jgi:Zn-finger nucleic acid-binding protein
MDCPKCNSAMAEILVGTPQGRVTIDQCSSCKGFWFDTGEAEKLKDRWRPDFIDSGDPQQGKEFNKVRDVNCPRCDKPMEKVNDPKQRHIQLETCREHGVFMDAGEFSDYTNETLMDIFRGAVSLIRGG